MISRRAALAALLVTAGSASVSAHPHRSLEAEQQGDIERQLMAFRAELKDAVAAKDAGRLRAMYAEGYTHTHASGKMDGREARLSTLLAGDPVIETASASEILIRVHGPDMAVATGRSPIPSRQDGRTVDVRWIQVFSRATGSWQLAASQATRLAVVS